MSERLKPCPFCGSENVRFEGEKHAVVCMRCKARGCIAPTEDASLDMWNDRAGDDHIELTSVNIGEVATFPGVKPDKAQALKVLEEAAEKAKKAAERKEHGGMYVIELSERERAVIASISRKN